MIHRYGLQLGYWSCVIAAALLISPPLLDHESVALPLALMVTGWFGGFFFRAIFWPKTQRSNDA